MGILGIILMAHQQLNMVIHIIIAMVHILAGMGILYTTQTGVALADMAIHPMVLVIIQFPDMAIPGMGRMELPHHSMEILSIIVQIVEQIRQFLHGNC